jgi:hypothetical protein
MTQLAGTVAAKPLVHLDAMAAIVRDLVAGGQTCWRDEQWLHARTQAGLGAHAAEALEALRQKLCQGTSLLSGDGTNVWA